MPETTNSATGANDTGELAPGVGSSDSGFTPITSQDELDRIIQPRIARERSKFEGFEDFKAKAARVDELEATNADLAGRVQGFETAEARTALVAKVAADTGVDASILADLKHDTEDELAGAAKRLAEHFKPSAPHIPGQHAQPGSAPGDEAREFRTSLFG